MFNLTPVSCMVCIMINLSDTFGLQQTIVFFSIALVSLIISFLIYKKDPHYQLNQTFSLAVGFLGLSYIFSFLGNLYYILNETGEIFFIRTAFFLAPVAFIFFYYTALGISKGTDVTYSKDSLALFFLLLVVDFVIIYGLNGVSFDIGSQTNSVSSLPFKVFDLGAIAILYFIVYYYFIQSYRAINDQQVKKNLSYFLIGWFFGGLGLFAIVGSDAFRILDLLGPITIVIGMIIISRPFLSKPRSSNS